MVDMVCGVPVPDKKKRGTSSGLGADFLFDLLLQPTNWRTQSCRSEIFFLSPVIATSIEASKQASKQKKQMQQQQQKLFKLKASLLISSGANCADVCCLRAETEVQNYLFHLQLLINSSRRLIKQLR